MKLGHISDQEPANTRSPHMVHLSTITVFLCPHIIPSNLSWESTPSPNVVSKFVKLVTLYALSCSQLPSGMKYCIHSRSLISFKYTERVHNNRNSRLPDKADIS